MLHRRRLTVVAAVASMAAEEVADSIREVAADSIREAARSTRRWIPSRWWPPRVCSTWDPRSRTRFRGTRLCRTSWARFRWACGTWLRWTRFRWTSWAWSLGWTNRTPSPGGARGPRRCRSRSCRSRTCRAIGERPRHRRCWQQAGGARTCQYGEPGKRSRPGGAPADWA